jgi:hypothetical protein
MLDVSFLVQSFDIACSQNRANIYTHRARTVLGLAGWLAGWVTGPFSLCAFANCFQSVAILKGEHTHPSLFKSKINHRTRIAAHPQGK